MFLFFFLFLLFIFSNHGSNHGFYIGLGTKEYFLRLVLGALGVRGVLSVFVELDV